MVTLLVLATVVATLQLAVASLTPVVDDAVDTVFDFDATLKRVYMCEGTNFKNYWGNCTYSRVSPETVVISMDIVVGREVPDDPTYMVEIIIENQPNENAAEKILIAAVTWANVCRELKDQNNDAVQKFLRKVDREMTCPIKTGVYKAVGVEISVEDVKPMLREGIMTFTIKQLVDSEQIACYVAEFIVTIE